MKKIFFILTVIASIVSFSSCTEKNEAAEYDNWKERNQHYVDSIAALAHSNKDGWTKILAFNLMDSVENINPNVNHYVYVKKLENGAGKVKPEFMDSVRVHYLGRLIPSASHSQGQIFDKSYNSYTLNEETDVPSLLAVRGTVVGYSTALQHMVEGDRWKVVIPYYLGYGEIDYSQIPGYSALIFDIKLSRIYKRNIDTNTTWH